MTDDNWQGNASTILMLVWVIVAPYIAQYLTQDQFTVIGVAVIGVILKLLDAYYPNTFRIFKNDVCTCNNETEDCLVLNDEYEVANDDN